VFHSELLVFILAEAGEATARRKAIKDREKVAAHKTQENQPFSQLDF
jgi:hypothetical protein